MWIEHNKEKGRVKPDYEKEYKYVLNEHTVCYIRKIRRRANRHWPPNWTELYRGRLYFKEQRFDDSEGRQIALLYDQNLDVLKLKCLVKAKEMGWDIKDMV